MLHILFMVLKIIGIILLAILGILILLLCVVFFVPLHYQVMTLFEGNLKRSKIEIKFSWFLHLMAGRITYMEEKLDYKIRVLWKKISEETTEDVKNVDKEKVESEKSKPEDIVDKVLEKADPDKMVDGILENEEKSSEKKTNASKLDKLKCTIKNVCDKIKMIVEFLKQEAHQSTVLRLKKEIMRLLAFLRPKKIRGKVHFGMEDPYRTGQILAVLSVLYPFYCENIEISPDFEHKILEGELHVKGHIRGVYALVIAINLLLDKNVRTTIKDIKALF